jgi:hypothetical protein
VVSLEGFIIETIFWNNTNICLVVLVETLVDHSIYVYVCMYVCVSCSV